MAKFYVFAFALQASPSPTCHARPGALHNFADSHAGRFPPAKVNGPAPQVSVPGPTKHGMGVFILPSLELQVLYDQYRWDLNASDPLNQPVGSTEDRDLLDEVAESFLERYRAGERPSVAEYVER